MRVVTPTLDGNVLQILARTDATFTSGDVARIANGPSPAGIRRTLERLAGQGIVSRKKAGRVFLYRLNPDHLAADAVRALASQRTELLHRLGATVATWEIPVLFGSLFGSAARGDHSVQSDLDLFLVHPHGADLDAWELACDDLAARATSWTGNDARILALSHSDVLDPRGNAALLAAGAHEGLAFVGDPAWLRGAV